MARNKKRVPAAGSRKVVRAFTYGVAPILKGEDSKAYDELLSRISGAVGPRDVIEEIWISDIANMTWEIIRYRNYKTGLIKAAVPTVLEEVLDPAVMKLIEERSPDEARFQRSLSSIGEQTKTKEVVSVWMMGKSDTVEWVEDTLGNIGLTMEDINARALALAIDDIERVDRLSWRVETSRDALLQQIERRRAAFAERLRHAARVAEEGEFEKDEIEVIPPAADDQAA